MTSNPEVHYPVGHQGRLGQVHRLGLELELERKQEQGGQLEPGLVHRQEEEGGLGTEGQLRQQPKERTKQQSTEK